VKRRRRRANLLVAVNDVRMHAKIQCQRDHLGTERNRSWSAAARNRKSGTVAVATVGGRGETE
jgi:hypothetical protein